MKLPVGTAASAHPDVGPSITWIAFCQCDVSLVFPHLVSRISHSVIDPNISSTKKVLEDAIVRFSGATWTFKTDVTSSEAG